ncbi:MAG: hypothetical protein WBW48_09280 [Anaerolineae bacterium]
MVKNVLFKAGRHMPAALVASGWVAFALGYFARSHSEALAFSLLAIARVLP